MRAMLSLSEVVLLLCSLLGHEDFFIREKAQEILLTMGPATSWSSTLLLKHHDLEIRRRASFLLFDRATAILKESGHGGWPWVDSMPDTLRKRLPRDYGLRYEDFQQIAMQSENNGGGHEWLGYRFAMAEFARQLCLKGRVEDLREILSIMIVREREVCLKNRNWQWVGKGALGEDK